MRVGLFSQGLGELWRGNPAEIPLPGQLQCRLLPPCCVGLPVSILGCLLRRAGGDATTLVPSQPLGQGKAPNCRVLLRPHGNVTRDVWVIRPPGPTAGLSPGASGENAASSLMPRRIFSP